MPDLFLSGVVGDEITAKKVRNFLASEKSENITVVINSVGGDAFEGIEIYNLLCACGKKVTTVISGMAASAASVIFLAGDERIAMAGTSYMIHKPKGLSYGESHALRKDAEMLDKLQENVENIYHEKTNINNITKAVDDTNWYTVSEMKEKGITNSERKIILNISAEDEEIDPTFNANIETEEKTEMARIDDLKAELEEQKKINAELEEKAEEAKLEAELAELKAANAAMQTTEPQTVAKGEDTIEPKAATKPNTIENAEGSTKPADTVVEEPKEPKQPEVIDTKNTVAETTMKNELPAFMQASSKY
ncbi:head maturation protease, ClpP-related [Enterococcus sp. AZ177]|uniref:head maturation protease, ClpP-related n=1 Tax=unclassified Enterococcus TaxID=2608891 RepID=UPI003D300901